MENRTCGCSPVSQPNNEKQAACCEDSAEAAGSPSPPHAACCPSSLTQEMPGYRIWPFVCGWLDTPMGKVPQVMATLDREDLLGRWQMRWGIGRMKYRIAPGLYAVGRPDSGSPILVTGNYKMSFDTLRRELDGRHLWILVLETHGINVWCAAGKGTFGTEELIRRVRAAGLAQIVDHRRLVVPQLGAVGVAAHEVRRECGFEVIYGPVRAADLPVLLDRGPSALSPDMRQVTFSMTERLALTPVEMTGMLRHLPWALLFLLVLGGIGPGIFSLSAAFFRGGAAILAGLLGVAAGAVVTPVLLPWIPGRPFALKGALVGSAIAILCGFALHLDGANFAALILALTALSSYCAMNFTGSTPFTSPSGVEKEMRRALPLQACALLLAGIFWIGAAFTG